MSSVQTLETMRKLNEIKSYVRNTLDKLLGVRGNLIRSNDSWQYYGFCELVEALRKWTDRNLKIIASDKNPEGDNVYHTKEREREQTTCSCVFCEKDGHKSSECKIIECVSDCKSKILEKKLCFSCTGSKHQASECRSTKTCEFCNEKHQSSLCKKSRTCI